jgi:D-3-phosphoglycerate dehydrogenase
MLLFLARGQLNGKSGFELRGKKLGIHAFGNVGSLVAQIAKGFMMDVYAYDPFVTKEKIEALGIKVFTDMKEMYKTCDFISLHLPKTKDTIKLINYELLSLMPIGAAVINTARKEVIDENCIKIIMSERKDFRYATDITPDNDADMKLFGERYFTTPKKMGAQTEEANINAGIAAARQIVSFFENDDTTFQVNKKK